MFSERYGRIHLALVVIADLDLHLHLHHHCHLSSGMSGIIVVQRLPLFFLLLARHARLVQQRQPNGSSHGQHACFATSVMSCRHARSVHWRQPSGSSLGQHARLLALDACNGASVDLCRIVPCMHVVRWMHCAHAMQSPAQSSQHLRS